MVCGYNKLMLLWGTWWEKVQENPDVTDTTSQLANFFSCFLQSVDPGQQFTWENSNLEVNKPKNRYANVIAYDHSRVILSSIEGKMHSSRVSLFFLTVHMYEKKKKLGKNQTSAHPLLISSNFPTLFCFVRASMNV